jgi:hypothetical protein
MKKESNADYLARRLGSPPLPKLTLRTRRINALGRARHSFEHYRPLITAFAIGAIGIVVLHHVTKNRTVTP